MTISTFSPLTISEPIYLNSSNIFFIFEFTDNDPTSKTFKLLFEDKYVFLKCLTLYKAESCIFNSFVI